MPTRKDSSTPDLPAYLNPPSNTALGLYCKRVDVPQGAPMTVFVLKSDLTKQQRQAVLAELRTCFPGVGISMIGDEIAVWAVDPGVR